MYIKSYKELLVWQKSIILVQEVYLLTKSFPKEELFGLTSQMRRASVSIPSNIAEGYTRTSPRDYAHFYAIAYGSAVELETQLIISRNIKYITDESHTRIQNLLTEILKMLHTMIITIKTKQLNAK